jgi:O-antigen biosynthesis protein
LLANDYSLHNKKMKIAYLIPGCGVSGGIAVVCQHVNRLQSRGYKVLLVSETNDKVIDWFPNQLVPIISLADYPNNVDILVATAWSTSFRVALLEAKHKFYFVQSDETRFHEADSAWEHITRLSYKIDFNYITEARWIKKWLLDGFGHSALLVPNGLDQKIFFPTKPISPRGKKTRVLLEGAIGLPYKGMRQAFEAVEHLDVEVWCVSSYGKPEKSWKCDRFFEHVPMTNMRQVYSSCDILLKLSQVEGFFGPPMEMMACGGAVVVGRVTGYDEYIVDEFNALVVDALDPLQAANAIQRLIDDPLLKEKLVINGSKTALEWEWDTSIDALENHFKSVLSGNDGVNFTNIKSESARSAAYFYYQLRGVTLTSNNLNAGDSAIALSEQQQKSSESEKQALLSAKRMVEVGATEKLLAWLRNKFWFRKFATLAWRIYKRT